jgi:hypothetical protein
MVANLIENQHFSRQIDNIFYFGCPGNDNDLLDWHVKLTDVAVHYNGESYLKK